MKNPRLARLIVLAELHREHALGRLASTDAEISRRRAAADALNAPCGPPDETLGALRAADAWQRWREAETRRIQIASAHLAAERETLRAAAARATGRLEALRKLSRR